VLFYLVDFILPVYLLNIMLSLHSSSSDRWLKQVESNLDEILIDHAHCEKKAAGTAMNFIFAYVDNLELCREMTEIVNEELEHFHMVIDILHRRKIEFRRIRPSSYGRKLNDLVRRGEPERAIDRMLVACLIEARSCERFDFLRKYMDGKDQELSDFYGSLFESEARHHTTYVRMAKFFGSDDEVKQRLNELSAIEAEIIEIGDDLPRMHS
jgi:tRNA 2-(methylsulfanyl)-N6-isopentenyladenosine37 hydroxylase